MSTTPEVRFATIVEAFGSNPAVTLPSDGLPSKKGFGSSALKVNGKICAMLSAGRLVVKISRQRVDQLVSAGDGERFDPRRDGRLMQEWFCLAPSSSLEWLPLIEEALAFVGSKAWDAPHSSTRNGPGFS